MIYKYPLDIADEVTIDIPNGAKMLSVQIQRNSICVWADVNPDAKEVPYLFHVVATGDAPPGCTEYLGTIQLNNGHRVFHIYYRRA